MSSSFYLTFLLTALTATAMPTNNNFHPVKPCAHKLPEDQAAAPPQPIPEPQPATQSEAQSPPIEDSPHPGPYHLAASLGAHLTDDPPTYPNLCVLPATYSAAYYIGTGPYCQSNPWYLSDKTLSSTILDHDAHTTQPFSSLPIDLDSLSNPGQYITLTHASPNHIGDGGDYGTWGNGAIPDDRWPNGLLRVMDTPGEYSNWWLCPVPDGSEGLVLKYGFHKGFGELKEDKGCEVFTLKLAPVKPVRTVVVTPHVVEEAEQTAEEEIESGLGWLRNFGLGGQCVEGEFRLACWAQRKVLGMWEGFDKA